MSLGKEYKQHTKQANSTPDGPNSDVDLSAKDNLDVLLNINR